ncbi:dimerization domain-containing protein [Heracleum sosnowskyi]|uniref:Dimerization domain-containing protein n=1 Tax=Heracleum sosnowskyi TaxID=360622 RepID=A0AAD8IBN7_9APIA|nr:dimerization domain-containing protein [Heracleum sosnowskyi]
MERMTKNEATHENEETAQGQVDTLRFVHGFAEMAVVKCAVELGIPDILEKHAEPMTLSQLSSSLACSSAPLFRGLFKEKKTNQGSMGYVQTPMSRLLVKDGNNSFASENCGVMCQAPAGVWFR